MKQNVFWNFNILSLQNGGRFVRLVKDLLILDISLCHVLSVWLWQWLLVHIASMVLISCNQFNVLSLSLSLLSLSRSLTVSLSGKAKLFRTTYVVLCVRQKNWRYRHICQSTAFIFTVLSFFLSFFLRLIVFFLSFFLSQSCVVLFLWLFFVTFSLT